MDEFVGRHGSEAPLVSVLFITYKRFDLLKRAVEQFRANTEYPNLEIVIADDGSVPEVQEKIRGLGADRFALPRQNKGLGANFNQGLALCNGKYVLLIQDDWICHGPPEYLAEAVRIFESNSDLGLINFAGAAHPPDISRRLPGSNEPCYLTPEPLKGPIKYFLYSDQPHLQSRTAIDWVGPYLESKDMEQCETDYNYRWQQQTRFTTAVFPGYYHKVFVDEGQQHSFRTTRIRYRVHNALLPMKSFLLRYAPALFTGGKAAIERTLCFLERRGILR